MIENDKQYQSGHQCIKTTNNESRLLLFGTDMLIPYIHARFTAIHNERARQLQGVVQIVLEMLASFVLPRHRNALLLQLADDEGKSCLRCVATRLMEGQRELNLLDRQMSRCLCGSYMKERLWQCCGSGHTHSHKQRTVLGS